MINIPFENFDFLEWLLHREADPNIKNNKGNTAMHLAFKTQNYSIIIYLINKNGDLNIKNNRN